jgi:SAM-dependent methyltransferase
LLNRFNLKGEAVCGDAAQLQFPDNHFDGVISSDFFEHITDDVKVTVLREIARVLKPGKPVVIKTPNLSYLKIALFYKRMRALARLRNPSKIVIPHTPGTDDPQHVGLVTRWALTQCLYQAGFGNFQFFYAPLRRFGSSRFMEAISTEIPILRDKFCEDVFCIALKPIALAHFPD